MGVLERQRSESDYRLPSEKGGMGMRFPEKELGAPGDELAEPTMETVMFAVLSGMSGRKICLMCNVSTDD